MTKRITLCLLFAYMGAGNLAAQHNEHTSEYVGQEKREIKSLSESDIEELKAGKGWGLAKAAELNGVPGPSHVLEMKAEISLSETQEEKIAMIFEKMQQQAMQLGTQLIEKERELNAAFASREIDTERLKELTSELGKIKAGLSYTHLAAHLETKTVLTEQQIQQYNELRGYNISNPCAEVPEGHDPELWKKHNNCSE